MDKNKFLFLSEIYNYKIWRLPKNYNECSTSILALHESRSVKIIEANYLVSYILVTILNNSSFFDKKYQMNCVRSKIVLLAKRRRRGSTIV